MTADRSDYKERLFDRRPRLWLVAVGGGVWLTFYAHAAALMLVSGDADLALAYLAVSFPLTWVGTVAMFWRQYGRL